VIAAVKSMASTRRLRFQLYSGEVAYVPTAHNTTQNTVNTSRINVRKFPSADLLSHWWERMHD